MHLITENIALLYITYMLYLLALSYRKLSTILEKNLANLTDRRDRQRFPGQMKQQAGL